MSTKSTTPHFSFLRPKSGSVFSDWWHLTFAWIYRYTFLKWEWHFPKITTFLSNKTTSILIIALGIPRIGQEIVLLHVFKRKWHYPKITKFFNIHYTNYNDSSTGKWPWLWNTNGKFIIQNVELSLLYFWMNTFLLLRLSFFLFVLCLELYTLSYLEYKEFCSVLFWLSKMKVDVISQELSARAMENGKKQHHDEFVSPLAVTWFNFRMNQVFINVLNKSFTTIKSWTGHWGFSIAHKRWLDGVPL